MQKDGKRSVNNRAQTLIILTPGFPESEADTTCLPPRQTFIKALKNNHPNINIVVVTFQYPFMSGVYGWYGIQVISLNGATSGKINMLVTWFRAWKVLRQLNKENQIIGLLSFWLGECALVGKYFGKLYKLKQYTWLLGQDAKRGNKFYSLVKPNPVNLIALSDFIAKEFSRNYSIKPKHTIPVGVDISLFNKEQVPRDIDILGAGSLIPLKRYDLFICIVKQVVGYVPNIKVAIAGKGPEKDRLQALINASHLQSTISLLGEVSNTEVLALMQQSKIFLHPSSYEGYGSVCAEALYAGAHVVSFCKPMDIDIRHWHILNNKEKMIKELVELLQNPDLNHERVLTASADEVANAVFRLYA